MSWQTQFATVIDEPADAVESDRNVPPPANAFAFVLGSLAGLLMSMLIVVVIASWDLAARPTVVGVVLPLMILSPLIIGWLLPGNLRETDPH